MVEEAANVDVDSIVQDAWGNHNIQFAGISSSTFNITTNVQQAGPAQPAPAPRG
jgi:hypothetical protein